MSFHINGQSNSSTHPAEVERSFTLPNLHKILNTHKAQASQLQIKSNRSSHSTQSCIFILFYPFVLLKILSITYLKHSTSPYMRRWPKTEKK